MSNPITIAIDAMGGEDSPNKVIEGINLHSKVSNNTNYRIFGNSNLIKPLIEKYYIPKDRISLVHTD